MSAGWDVAAYAGFADLRLRPALDLLAQVPSELPQGPVVDLGCGNGAVAGALKSRYPANSLVGVDLSENMLAAAEETDSYDRLELHDIGDWQPDEPPALIFSNAALHWLPDHRELFTRLAACLLPGGVLAVQMPVQQLAPSHALMREIAAREFPDVFDFSGWKPQVSAALDYAGWLGSSGTLSLWFTEYMQYLGPVAEGHPVRYFTASTAMRPFAEKLGEAELRRFIHLYDEALFEPYPLNEKSGVWFPFRRFFLILQKD